MTVGTNNSTVGTNKQTISDTIGLGYNYNLLKEKTIKEFIQKQNIKFEILSDTVINDERGIVIGKKLIYNESFVQWINDSSISRLEINNPEISLNYGIHCDMSKDELIKNLKLKPFHFDTLTFGIGFLENRVDFYFSGGKLKRIYLENLPD
ncbi:MAG: hypothetical protein NTX03_10260 [Bacteroidetes bacterium]|nr:hypothetical protein [Bacteroidota bacterium]